MGRVKDGSSEMPVPAGVKYLVSTQFLIRFSVKGTQAVLVLFLFEHLHLSENLSTELVHVFLTIMNLGPVVGAVLSDGYLGKYRALLVCLLLHLGGMVILVLGAVPNADIGQRTVLACVSAVGLFFIAASVGSEKPCITAFGGDQVEVLVPEGPERVRQRSLFFSLWYVGLNAGSFLATIAIPPLRIFGSYFLIFSVQTAVLVACVLVFWTGRKHYTHRSIKENVFVKVGAIVVDALRFRMCKGGRLSARRGSISGEGHRLLAEGEIVSNEELGASTGDAELHWLDGAKLKHDSDAVEDVKRLFRVLGLFTVLPVFWALFEQQYTKWVFQARSMNRQVPWLGGVVLQPESIQALNPILVLILIPLLDRAVYPLFTKLNVPLPPLRKMVIGMAAAVVAFVASGMLQLALDGRLESISTGQMSSTGGPGLALKVPPRRVSEAAASMLRLNVMSTPGELSVFWQVPQYIFITLAEVLINITGLDFSYSQAPASMKSLLQGSYNCTQALGDFMTAIIVAVVGERLSKANEFFLFAGGCAAAMVRMVWITHGYVDCQRPLPARTDPMPVETMVE